MVISKPGFSLSHLFILIAVLLTSSLIIQPAYAKQASYIKSVDIEKEFLEEAFEDIKSYPYLFGNRIQKVTPIQLDDYRKIIRIKGAVSGFTINGDIEYTKGPNGEHVVNIISGNLKETKIITTLTKRAGFTGIPDKGTDVNMQLDLRMGGLMGFLAGASLSQEDLRYMMDLGILEFVKVAEQIREKKLSESNPSETISNQFSQQSDEKGFLSQLPDATPSLSMKAWNAQFLDQNYVLVTGSVSLCQQFGDNAITLRLYDPEQKIFFTDTIPLTKCSFNERIRLSEDVASGNWKAISDFHGYQNQVSFFISETEKIIKESVKIKPTQQVAPKILSKNVPKAEFSELEFEISEEGEMIIVGRLEEFVKESPVYITITKPDASFDIRMSTVSNNGFFGTRGMLDDDSLEGMYMIKAEHGLPEGKATAYKASRYDKVSSDKIIPSWVKNNARWWTEGNLDDSDFYLSVQYLIKKGIIKIPETVSDSSMIAPDWVKVSAGWWVDGLTSDEDFIKQVEYSIKHQMI